MHRTAIPTVIEKVEPCAKAKEAVVRKMIPRKIFSISLCPTIRILAVSVRTGKPVPKRVEYSPRRRLV
jgi:hypothetical protein